MPWPNQPSSFELRFSKPFSQIDGMFSSLVLSHERHASKINKVTGWQARWRGVGPHGTYPCQARIEIEPQFTHRMSAIEPS